MSCEWSAGYRTCADGDHDLGSGDGTISLLEGNFHILRDGACDHKTVGVPWRGNELDAEPREIENNRAQHVEIRLAGVASPGTHLAELERPSKKSKSLRIQRFRKSNLISIALQIITAPGSETVIMSERNCTTRASLLALWAEEASSEIDRETCIGADRLCGTHVHAGVAALGTLGGVEHRPPAKMLGKRRHRVRIIDGSVTLVEAGEE